MVADHCAPPAEAETWGPAPAHTYTVEALRLALTVCIATKANFWLTDHHTGQGTVSGYVAEVLPKKYPRADLSQMTNAAHTVGHWISTLHVLNVAQIPNMRPVEPFMYVAASNFSLRPDALLRFTGLPAGTHRIGVAYEAATRIIKRSLMAICPSFFNSLNIPPSNLPLKLRITTASIFKI